MSVAPLGGILESMRSPATARGTVDLQMARRGGEEARWRK